MTLCSCTALERKPTCISSPGILPPLLPAQHQPPFAASQLPPLHAQHPPKQTGQQQHASSAAITNTSCLLLDGNNRFFAVVKAVISHINVSLLLCITIVSVVSLIKLSLAANSTKSEPVAVPYIQIIICITAACKLIMHADANAPAVEALFPSSPS